MAQGTASAQRDIRELEAAVRAADVLLRSAAEVAWSGRAADSYQQSLADLVRGLHRAVLGLEAMETLMTRHLRSVEDAHRQALSDLHGGVQGVPGCAAPRRNG